jgi:membrane-bound ClpP family serine protease
VETGELNSHTNERKVRLRMIVLGLVLLVVGFLTGIPILTTIGVILLVVGAVLFILGSMGRAVGGRKHYY